MKRDIIVVGASAGGVEAIPRLLGSLSAETPAAIFVVLHVSPHNESVMPAIISRNGCLPALHPKDGAVIRPRHIYVAPPDYHLMLEKGVVCLSHGPKENRNRPAIDPLFRSAAKAYGPRVVGVLLTGNLDDGVAGLGCIQDCGGVAIVQDPREAPYPDMPRNALTALKIEHVLPLEEIENLLKHLTNSHDGARTMKSKQAKGDEKRSSQSPETVAEEPSHGPPIPLVCPECQGPVWEFRDGKMLRFECLVGHRYTLQNLLVAQKDEIEQALWVALRALEERVTLQRRLAAQAKENGRSTGRGMFLARANQNARHARVLRKIIEKLPT